jgi:transcriptional regulator with XRE-family HTH domain
MDTKSNPTTIREARERKGLSLKQLADALAISTADAFEVKLHDDEVVTTLDLCKLARLLTQLGLTLSEVFPNASFTADASKSPNELKNRVLAFCQSEGMQMVEFEDKAGWEIGTFIQNPTTAWVEWNVDCLNDVCLTIGEATEQYLKGMMEAEQPAPRDRFAPRDP